MSVYVDDGLISIIHTPNKTPYQIAVNRCNTYSQIVWWIAQLSEKNWCTREIIFDFLETACKEHGLDYHEDGRA